MDEFGTAHVDLAHVAPGVDREGVFVAGSTDGVLPGQASAGKTDAVDGSGKVLVVGSTMGALPGQTSSGSFDVFVMRMP